MRLVVVALAVLVAVSLLPFALAQPNLEEAAQVFEEAGCTQCHNGGMAPDFQGTVDVIAEWAQYYADIDEAVRNEYTAFGGADSYDEMMQQMKQYTKGVTDEQFRYLYDFFLQVFEYYKAQAPAEGEATTTTTQPPAETGTPAECPTTTVTVTVTETKTVTKTQESTATVIHTAPEIPPECRAKPGTARFVPVVAAVLVLAALGYAVYTLKYSS